jgi:hypothetical protein
VSTDTGLIDPKNAVFIAVKSHRLARLPEIAFGSCAVTEEAFAGHKE